jgi:4-hydroxybenzoate polyprenyltransferase
VIRGVPYFRVRVYNCPGKRKMLKALLVSIRPRQWYKNLLLFVGIIFSANFLNASMWLEAFLAFVFFCLLSSGEYLINDIVDRARDRRHPLKRKRPIASGALKVSYALSFAVILILIALLGSYFAISMPFFIFAASYVLLVLLYSLLFKRLVIADVLIISIGFVLRAVAGCVAIGVIISPWLIVCSLLLALLLVFGKRRGEVASVGEKAAAKITGLSSYSVVMLDQLIGISAAAAIVSYLMYSFFMGNYYMMLTVPSVVYGLFRYLFLVHQENFGGELERIFKDKPTLINLAIWVLLVVIVLY